MKYYTKYCLISFEGTKRILRHFEMYVNGSIDDDIRSNNLKSRAVILKLMKVISFLVVWSVTFRFLYTSLCGVFTLPSVYFDRIFIPVGCTCVFVYLCVHTRCADLCVCFYVCVCLPTGWMTPTLQSLTDVPHSSMQVGGGQPNTMHCNFRPNCQGPYNTSVLRKEASRDLKQNRVGAQFIPHSEKRAQCFVFLKCLLMESQLSAAYKYCVFSSMICCL